MCSGSDLPSGKGKLTVSKGLHITAELASSARVPREAQRLQFLNGKRSAGGTGGRIKHTHFHRAARPSDSAPLWILPPKGTCPLLPGPSRNCPTGLLPVVATLCSSHGSPHAPTWVLLSPPPFLSACPPPTYPSSSSSNVTTSRKPFRLDSFAHGGEGLTGAPWTAKHFLEQGGLKNTTFLPYWTVRTLVLSHCRIPQGGTPGICSVNSYSTSPECCPAFRGRR